MNMDHLCIGDACTDPKHIDDRPNASEAEATLPACPECGGTLSVVEKFVAKPLGTWSLAGAQPKATGRFWPHLVCDGCDLSKPAKASE
jgi:hypothetical protein